MIFGVLVPYCQSWSVTGGTLLSTIASPIGTTGSGTQSAGGLAVNSIAGCSVEVLAGVVVGISATTGAEVEVNAADGSALGVTETGMQAEKRKMNTTTKPGRDFFTRFSKYLPIVKKQAWAL